MVAVASIHSAVRIGDRIDGRYRVIDLIADGGMGTVFLAEHTLIKRRVAVKVLHRDLATDVLMIQRFLNEASAAGTLGHPNIVESTDMGYTPDGVPFIVFEYLEGVLLTKEIYRVGGLPIRRALRIASQIASALDAAHAAGLVHADLKSDNIFLIERGGTLDHVKVLDFGIARVLGSDLDRPEIAGTPQFMAPEQITAPAAVDERADIYALGVVLYELLCARRPFDDDDQRVLLHRIVHEAPPPLDRDLPEELQMLIGSMLAKQPSARPASMKQVIAVLDQLADELESRAVPPVPEPVVLPPVASVVELPAPRRGWPVSLVVLASLAAAAGGAASMVEQRRITGLHATAVHAIESDAVQLASVIDSNVHTLHQRAAAIASSPVLRSAIETDAATLEDLATSEHVITAERGETIAVFQGSTEVLRLPRTAPALGQGLQTSGGELVLAVSEPVLRAGKVAVAAPIDTHVIRARLAGDALAVTLTGLAQPVELIRGGAGEEIVVPVAVAPELASAPLALHARVHPPKRGALLTTARDAAFAMAGALVLGFVVIGLRRRA